MDASMAQPASKPAQMQQQQQHNPFFDLTDDAANDIVLADNPFVSLASAHVAHPTSMAFNPFAIDFEVMEDQPHSEDEDDGMASRVPRPSSHLHADLLPGMLAPTSDSVEPWMSDVADEATAATAAQ
jgi:hypothetical protein